MPAATSSYHSFQMSPEFSSSFSNSFYGGSQSASQSRQSYFNTWSGPTTARQERANLDSLNYWNQQSGYLSSGIHNSTIDQRQHPHMAVGAPTLQSAAYSGYPITGFIPSQQSYSQSRQINGDAARVEPRQQLQQQQPAQSEPRKEEKVAGGVSAHLDYEISHMTDYVAEMAQRIVLSTGSVSPTFRKFVSQILSATRLPSSTILLALHYLSVRVDMLNGGPPQKQAPDHIYRMLTTALLLGSKFLDDNTFQNRSWCEVTGIPVTELNKMEREWLAAINWDLHVDPEDQYGFPAWSRNWKKWQAEQYQPALKKLSILAPIETNIQRQPVEPIKHLSPLPAQRPDYSLTPSHSLAQYHLPSAFDQSWMYAAHSSQDSSPPSAPETGPNTPEYLGLGSSWSQPAAQQQYNLNSMSQYRQLPQIVQPQQNCSYQPQMGYQTPSYVQNIWSHHSPNCRCDYCSKAFGGYMMPSIYGQQTVVG